MNNANIKRIIEVREKECLHLITEIRRDVQGNFKAEYFIEYWDPFEETVNTIALRHRCEFIVMGTKGASRIKKIL